MSGISDRIKATATVFTGPSVYYQTVQAIKKYPTLIPEVVAQVALKYRRELKSAEYRLNNATDRVEILCPVTNVTAATIGAGVSVGEIRWAVSPVGPYNIRYAPAATNGQIGPHSNGKLFAVADTPSTNLKQQRLWVALDLGPGNGAIETFDELFLDF
jgi:hypothetical protein